MADYYKKFCYNFSVIAEPLTNLISKRMRFKWTNDCQNSFDILKAILRSELVLLAPNFDKEFKLAIGASDVDAGGVLLQEDDNGVDHPVCYFFQKVLQTSEELFYSRERMFVSHSCYSTF